ncbi:type III-B CRISPR module-associated Cmr3 family protein [Chthonomonas calidirosea]|uniref:type III-B CRISPR module-associated Cmr3 family protein n=1 Tax=Chthonomonas calidirosea TaxID=454171 RepID=UPI0006EC92AB|nr:type III-B CRISPR module-associated Cmr3 family protein [Chthonomonas calidirosea]CEK16965.1 CRISPR-associated protein (Cas_Cmr3) [Chthonomonas calidirosea]
MRAFQILPIEPLLLRDGRPFSTDEGALDATSLNAHAGHPCRLPAHADRATTGYSWEPSEVAILRDIGVAGPLLLKNETVCFPAPADAVVLDGKELMTLRPFEPEKGGCNLRPGLLPLKVTKDGKPAPGYTYWKARDMFQWLAGNVQESFLPEEIGDFLRATSLHGAIDPRTHTAQEGRLYSTEMVVYEQLKKGKEYENCDQKYESWSFLVAAEVSEEEDLCTVHTLGGERRLAAVREAP